MKKIFKLTSKLNNNISKIALVAALCAVSSANAETKGFDGTYVGIDAIYSKMKFKKDYGSNIFSQKATPGLNVFVGHMFNENWGAELGYEVEKKMKRTETVNSGQKVAGVFIDPTQINWQSFKTTLKQHHPYLGIIAKTNIFGSNNFVSLMVGMSVSHIEAKYNYFQNNNGSTDITRTFSNTKPIAVIRASFEHKFNEQFGLRTLASWKNTSRFKVKSQENSASNSQIKLKNTFNVGIGAIYYI